MRIIVLAACICGPLTSMALWSHGAIVALLCAPIGGSCGGVAGGLLIAAIRARRERAQVASHRAHPDMQYL